MVTVTMDLRAKIIRLHVLIDPNHQLLTQLHQLHHLIVANVVKPVTKVMD